MKRRAIFFKNIDCLELGLTKRCTKLTVFTRAIGKNAGRDTSQKQQQTIVRFIRTNTKQKNGSRKRETNDNFFILLCVKRNSIFICIVLVTVISPVEFGLQSFRNRLTVSYDFNQLILDPFFDDRISRIYPKFQLVKRIMSRFVYDPRSINVT